MPTKVINNNEIPNHIFGADMSKKDKKNLISGKFSETKEFFLNGEHRTGKVKLDNGRLYFKFQQKDIEIPDKILNKKLTAQEKERLYKNEEIQIDKKTSILIDKDINVVIIRSKEADGQKIPKTIGGYQINEKDKKLLADGKNLSAKVYKGQYGYFIANVKMTTDRKGLEFSNIKGLKPNEVNTYLEKYNTKQSIQTPETKINPEKNKNISTNEKTLTQAIKDNDYDKIHELVKNGAEVKKEHINLANGKGNNIEKIAALTALGVEAPKQEIERRKPESEKKLSKEKQQPIDKGHHVEKTAGKVKNVIDTGFNQ